MLVLDSVKIKSSLFIFFNETPSVINIQSGSAYKFHNIVTMRIAVDNITIPAGTQTWYEIEELPLSLQPANDAYVYFSGYNNNSTSNFHMEFLIRRSGNHVGLRILDLETLQSSTDIVIAPRATVTYVSN